MYVCCGSRDGRGAFNYMTEEGHAIGAKEAQLEMRWFI